MSDTVFCLITGATISHRYEDDHWEHWGCFSKLSLDVTSKDLHCWRWLEEDPPVVGLVGAGLGWVRGGGRGSGLGWRIFSCLAGPTTVARAGWALEQHSC